MVKRNPNFEALPLQYLFPEISKRVREFSQRNPQALLISLSVGDTSQPICEEVIQELKQAAHDLGTREKYRGYGAEQGNAELRVAIAQKIYQGRVTQEEIFVSDGAKCDIGRLQLLFGKERTLAIQNPSYPVYVDTSLIAGQKQIHYLPCTPENSFLPDLENFPKTDLIFFCSPNNPTGAVASHAYLASLVKIAKKNRSILVYDAAYSAFIKDPTLPRSIYEIEGAHEVAIEISSFSKLIGFTGVRLGWAVVPKALCYEDGKAVWPDWSRIVTTFFNGASNIAQRGGCATLQNGFFSIDKMISYYRENARLLKSAFVSKGLNVYGGDHAPYLWIRFNKSSWQVFQLFLESMHLITTPGVGFGSLGDGFIRISALGKREEVEQAVMRILEKWPASLS